MAQMDILDELEAIGVIGDIDLTPSLPEGEVREQEAASEDVADEPEETEELEESEGFDFSGLCSTAMGQLDDLIESAKQLRRTFSILAEATGRRSDG